jgi:hypothetical protein
VTCRVDWTGPAGNQLADAWTRAPDRAAVTAAAHAIDVALGRDPVGESESRESDLRVLFRAPIGVLFHLDPEAGAVSVVYCWTFRTRT